MAFAIKVYCFLSNIYNQIDKDANKIWKFEKYKLVVEYEEMPLLPPPFIIILHVYQFLRLLFICSRTFCIKKNTGINMNNTVMDGNAPLIGLKFTNRLSKNIDNNYKIGSKIIEKKMTKQVLDNLTI